MKVGVSGAVRDISDLKVGVSGAVRAVSEAYIGVNGAVKKVWPLLPVGTQIVLDTVGSGTWECLASGRWTLEMHGGGGAAVGNQLQIGPWGSGLIILTQAYAGGASGSTQTVTLSGGTKYNYMIGGGAVGGVATTYPKEPENTIANGGNTQFGSWSISGGKSSFWVFGEGAPVTVAGVSYGNLATQPSTPDSEFLADLYVVGGKGGSTIGNYGDGGDAEYENAYSSKQPNGQDGAIILTYLG